MGYQKNLEKAVAKKHKGKARPASGAMWGLKRDVRSNGHYLMEHKLTSAASFPLDVRDFKFLEKQCKDPLPVYMIEFEGGGSLYAVPGELDETEREIIRTKYFSCKLSIPETVNVKICYTKVHKVVSILTHSEFMKVCEALNVEA